jgi:putative transposase
MRKEMTRKKPETAMTPEKENERKAGELMEELVGIYGISREAILGRGGLVETMTKRAIEAALSGELTHFLGYERGSKPLAEEPLEGGEEGLVKNCRNGFSRKRLLGADGQQIELAIPRDRVGEFEPVLVPKGQRRFEEFDERIIALYARGMTVREIQGFLEDQYKVKLSPDFISTVTDAVREDVVRWQARPLERLYPVVFFDAMRVKIREDGVVKNKAVHFALGVGTEGNKEVLGFWIEQQEGAKFWLKVMNELKNRGVQDVIIAVVDGLKGFPEAIETVFPQARVQTCVVHLMRNSLDFCSWKDRQEVADALKPIYKAATVAGAEQALESFEQGAWAKRYPLIAPIWRRAWERVIPFFDYPPEIRKVLYTTNVIENLHRQLRKVTKTRGQFPSDEAASKLIYLALQNITKKWQKPMPAWRAAAAQFAIQYPERFSFSSAS